MKATGVVRRIDDLGRVVIPKEIRKTLRIKEGDPLEIFTDREGQVILKNILQLANYQNLLLDMQKLLLKQQGILHVLQTKIQLLLFLVVLKKNIWNKI